jgi:hypothetical protein
VHVLCLTARQELSHQRVGLASPDNSDTHNSNRRGSGSGVTSYTSAASVEDREQAELQATQWRLRWRTGDVAWGRQWRTGSRRTSREPAAGVMDRRRSGPALGLGEPESAHRWTGTTCRAAPLACSDWSEERGDGRSRLDRVEGGGDNGKPGRTGRHPRLAVTRVLICAVGALVITPWDIISHGSRSPYLRD